MILLSFDIEEFDLPIESGGTISKVEQITLSAEGTLAILQILKQYQAKATFFVTAYFAEQAPDLIRQIASDGHEIASHGYYHDRFENADLLRSKIKLQEISQSPVSGFRMARMMPICQQDILEAGYLYNSSLNPTLIPGRYNHLNEPRTWFYDQGLLQLPAGVTPLLRIPLFWLSLHILPLWLYKWLLIRTYRHDQYVVLYQHPWEFSNQLYREEFKIASYIKRNSGTAMQQRLSTLIEFCRQHAIGFMTHQEWINAHVHQ